MNTALTPFGLEVRLVCEIREEMLRFIILFKQRHDGNSPTYREIMRSTGISSTSMVAYHLDKLERAGRIERPQMVGNTRVIEVVGGRWVGPVMASPTGDG